LLCFLILVQKPAPVYDIKVTQSDTSAQVSWGTRTEPAKSSYITKYSIYLNQKYKTIPRQKFRTEFNFPGLKPNTKYTVIIWAGDGNLQWSHQTDKEFMTNEAGEEKRWFTEYILTMIALRAIVFSTMFLHLLLYSSYSISNNQIYERKKILKKKVVENFKV
jgi:hypothetical protein